MKIWIDLSNSPHALLFEPIVEELRAAGHIVELSARDNAQTVELARERWPEVAVIGGESPRGRLHKAVTLARRVRELRSWAAQRAPTVAFSHNSYAQIIAARSLGIGAVTAMDFEHQPANHLAFRLAQLVLLPEAMRPLDLGRLGAHPHKTRFFPGLKEEIPLGAFTPDPAILGRIGIAKRDGQLLVVARTPPSRALYHGPGNELFLSALRVLADRGAQLVVLARHREQREALTSMALPNLVLPEGAVDARSLMYAADVVIGAGGTMTREAALLGVRTFSVFAGRQPAVDAWLADQGLLERLEKLAQLDGLRPPARRRRDVAELQRRCSELIPYFVSAVSDHRTETAAQANEHAGGPAHVA